MESRPGTDALFLYATEGILTVNEKGEIVRINPSAEKMFCYNPGELLGKPIEVLIPQGMSARHRSHRVNYIKNPHARAMGRGIELYGLKKDGTQLSVEVSLSPYSTNEGRFVIAFIIDITHRKADEEKLKNYSVELEDQVKKRTLILEEAINELEKTKKELHEALAKERELNELKSRFVSMASHEFRTPLATILSSVSLVAKYGEKGEREKQQRHIEKIKSSINVLTDILNDFLSVSKLEEGKVESVVETFNVEELITSVVQEMKPLAKAGQKIHYTHSGNTTVSMDKKLLTNILLNLVSNAIKFSPEGKQVELTSSNNAKAGLGISVKDEGIGIPEEEQKHLFERFFRAHNATAIQGTGLGLNIITKYLELMNGTINFSSKENKGTTFNLTFPQ